MRQHGQFENDPAPFFLNNPNPIKVMSISNAATATISINRVYAKSIRLFFYTPSTANFVVTLRDGMQYVKGANYYIHGNAYYQYVDIKDIGAEIDTLSMLGSIGINDFFVLDSIFVLTNKNSVQSLELIRAQYKFENNRGRVDVELGVEPPKAQNFIKTALLGVE